VSRWIGVLARLVTGLVWLFAGYEKFMDPARTVRAVRAFDLLPEAVVPLVGHTLPVLELVLGVTLLLGLLTRVSAVISAVLMVAFIVGISSAWARGMTIECGCFGGGGTRINATEGYRNDILRDLGLLALLVWLILRPRTPWALDNLIFRENREDA
jgi:uncharacterized membrane protein YphA (DoxX/SURF4 family)